MNRKYNYQAFTPDEVEQGLLQDLLNYLLEHNRKSKEDYYDIHITTDGYCTIVEWTDVQYDNKFGEEGRFRFVDYDQVVMLERTFPDNHTELCYDEEDYQERLKEFLEKNPGWVKGPFGNWTNEIENERFRKSLEDSCPCEHCVEDADNPTMNCDTCSYNHEDMDGDVCSECEDSEQETKISNNERLIKILNKLKETKHKEDSRD